MNNGKFVYVLTEDYTDRDNQDVEDLVYYADTDIKKVIDKVYINYSSNAKQIIVFNTVENKRDVISVNCRMEDFINYHSGMFMNDMDELNYFVKCLKQWHVKYNEYINSRREQEKKRQEEYDRIQYEKLKAKFEGK